MTVHRLREGHQIVGFVRNRSDRRVELIAEGDRQELEDFLASIEQRMSDHIRTRTIDFTEPTGEFQGFEIRETV